MSSAKVENTQKAYSRPEELTNFITCAVAALLSFVGLVFLLTLSIVSSSVKIGCFAFFTFTATVVFTFGALYHILPYQNIFRTLCGRFDRSAVALLVFGAFVSVFLVVLTENGYSNAVWGYSLFAVVAMCAIAITVSNLCNVKEYKLINLLVYVVLGWACVMRLDAVLDIAGVRFFGLIVGGGAAYFIGTAVLALRNIPARHTVWHLFIVCGAIFHFVAIYTYVL